MRPDSRTRRNSGRYRSVTRRGRAGVALPWPNPVTSAWPRMRVDYGSVEKDGSPDLDADWLAEGWVVLLRKWLATPRIRRRRRTERDGGGHRRCRRKTDDPHGVVQERGRRPASRSSPTTTPPKATSSPQTPYASATFPWFRLGRQVHVRGPVSKVSAAGHRRLLAQAAARFAAGRMGVGAVTADRVTGGAADSWPRRSPSVSPTLDDVPVPPNWGGYLISPEVVEFWQGREDRLHNRIRVSLRRYRAPATVMRL